MLKKLQEEQREWSKRNFGEQPPWRLVLGVVEEVGELAHAYLKKEQGIRTGEDHTAKTKDAVGDIVIYLADFCSAMGFDFEAIVTETWGQVKKRDWKAEPVAGGGKIGMSSDGKPVIDRLRWQGWDYLVLDTSYSAIGSCDGCAFLGDKVGCRNNFCTSTMRPDGKDVIFVKA